MDTRLIVTASFVAYLVAGAIFAGAALVTEVTFTEGQPGFIAGVGYGGPFVGLVLVWFRSYIFGAAIYVVSLLATAWYVLYFFFVHDNPATVFAVTGTGTTAYAIAIGGLVIVSLVASLVGCWLWYRASPGFRTVIHRLVGGGRST